MPSLVRDSAYILHTRPYRETSVLIEFFTQCNGRISAICRGGRGERSKIRGLLQPFVPLQIECSGNGELLTLRQIEASHPPHFLQSKALMSALYLNEILLRVMQRADIHSQLFLHYHDALVRLTPNLDLDISLRIFEMELLTELGYGCDFSCDAHTGNNVNAQQWYRFDVDAGMCADPVGSENDPRCFRGSSLLAITSRDFSNAQVRFDAKRLMRLALAPHLGTKPLKSRELFLELL